MTIIELRAFDWCSSLQYNEYNNGLYLGNDTNPYFALIKTISKDVTNINISENCVIFSDAFYGCKNLKSITIPNSVISIASQAFCGCTGLTSITLPNSVNYIGALAFYDCTGALYVNCNTEESQNVYSWTGGSKFSEIIIGDEVSNIGNKVFQELTSIKKLTIGRNVNQIGAKAFDRCTELKDIYCNALTPPLCRNSSFDEDTKLDCTLYVPAISIEDYKTAEVWKDFLTIKENPEYSGIECLTSEDTTSASMFNLQGQKVTTPTKGKIYIQNGKKFLMK